jgi:lipopolysaccharide export LptBFGC system permease protein LptF
MGGYTQANAALFKNDAAIKKTEAANQWNFYQAKSSKQNLSELSAELMTQPDKKQKYLDAVERYKTEKQEIKLKAEALEKESLNWDEQSEHQMHQHHRWSQATTSIQVSIAMAAIALLTRRRWMEYMMYGLAAIGVGLGVMAYLHV